MPAQETKAYVDKKARSEKADVNFLNARYRIVKTKRIGLQRPY